MEQTAAILVSVKDACTMVSCSRPTLYKHMREGRITAKRDGGRTKILVSSLKAFGEALPDMMPTQPS